MAAVCKSCYNSTGKGERRATNKRVLSKWEDLEKVGCSETSFRERLREIYGQEPEVVCVNESLCQEYGHFCHKVQGNCEWSSLQNSTVMATGDSKIVSNDTSETVRVRVELKSTQKRGIAVTVTQESNITLGNETYIHPPPHLSTHSHPHSLTIENTSGSSASSFEDITVEQSIDVVLEPGQRAEAVLNLSWTEVKGEFAVPFEIDGWFMSKFSESVNGQCLWLHEMSSIFDMPSSTLCGHFECVYNVRGSVEVRPL